MIDWAFSIPSSLKLHRGRTKYILKLAATGHLPEEILHRPKKGFAIPLRAWLRGPLRERVDRTLTQSPLWDSELFDRDAFRDWARMNAARMGDYSRALWALMVLDEWVRREKLAA
jgi:asparagine synthase (glutamine-hydrolysing)